MRCTGHHGVAVVQDSVSDVGMISSEDSLGDEPTRHWLIKVTNVAGVLSAETFSFGELLWSDPLASRSRISSALDKTIASVLRLRWLVEGKWLSRLFRFSRSPLLC